MRYRYITIPSLLLITIFPLFSQGKNTHTVQGYVFGYDQDEVEPLPGAHISVWNNDSTIEKTFTSDSNGFFENTLANVPYRIEISYVGYDQL